MTIIIFSSVTYAGNDNSSRKGHLITIHDRGTEKVVLTSGTTIGDALKEANVSVDSKDLVEPAVGEKLIAPNYQINIYRKGGYHA